MIDDKKIKSAFIRFYHMLTYANNIDIFSYSHS